jgi:glyoxylase-like metal-dependent hydrolase (beta-lactamase superfamily II)
VPSLGQCAVSFEPNNPHWNTHLVDGRWVSMFPNARYLIAGADVTYFDPEHADRMRKPKDDDERRRFRGIRLVFDDSIAPVREANQLETWENELRISEHLRLEAAPGHTPGSSVLWLESGAGAVFVGDLVHSPMQLERPDDACSFDIDSTQAAASRRTVLAEAERVGAFVVPAHFPGRGGMTLASTGSAWKPRSWLDLPAI